MITAEDADFCHRMLTAYPGAIAYRPAAMLFHRNRPDDASLRCQAWVYGEGVARMYRRYPSILPWHAGKIALVAARTVGRAVAPLGFMMARRFDLTTADRVEFSVYHRLWTWWFWCGFFRFYYGNPSFGVRQ